MLILFLHILYYYCIQIPSWRENWNGFNTQLSVFGLRLRDVSPDGNCLFRYVCVCVCVCVCAPSHSYDRYTCTSYIIIHHTSHITHHTSHITHHTSYIIHHTSHITHHTSHITHHTIYSVIVCVVMTLLCLLWSLCSAILSAVADQLEGVQSRHDHYRMETVKYMIKEPDNYKPFVFTGWDNVCTRCNCMCVRECVCVSSNYIPYMCCVIIVFEPSNSQKCLFVCSLCVCVCMCICVCVRL